MSFIRGLCTLHQTWSVGKVVLNGLIGQWSSIFQDLRYSSEQTGPVLTKPARKELKIPNHHQSDSGLCERTHIVHLHPLIPKAWPGVVAWLVRRPYILAAQNKVMRAKWPSGPCLCVRPPTYSDPQIDRNGFQYIFGGDLLFYHRRGLYNSDGLQANFLLTSRLYSTPHNQRLPETAQYRRTVMSLCRVCPLEKERKKTTNSFRGPKTPTTRV